MQRRAARICRALFLAGMLCAGAAGAAERDICENRTGPDLVRCIEASARGTPASTTQPATAPAARAAPPKSAAPATVDARTSPAPVATSPDPHPPEDCTGRSDEALRRCLAAGGRLAPSAAVTPASTRAVPAAPSDAAEACDGKDADALRRCIENSARSPTKLDKARLLNCTGYVAADQPLCVHRNASIAECQNRSRYPDFDVCLRSFMTRAPEPKRADCAKLAPRARAHCEGRNRVYERCAADKTGYFACLERHLGTDAVLTRR